MRRGIPILSLSRSGLEAVNPISGLESKGRRATQSSAPRLALRGLDAVAVRLEEALVVDVELRRLRVLVAADLLAPRVRRVARARELLLVRLGGKG